MVAHQDDTRSGSAETSALDPFAPGLPAPDPMAVAQALLAGLDRHTDEVFAVMGAVRDSSGDVVDLTYEWVGAAAERGDVSLVGRRLRELYTEEELIVLPEMLSMVGTGSSAMREVWFDSGGDVAVRLRGRVFQMFFAAAGADRLVTQIRDVTELRQAQRLLEHQAGHDELTGLPNRRLLRDHLTHALARLDRTGQPLRVLLADLDDFKAVNDTLGHAAGDELLMQVAHRLRDSVRAADVVARYGGDEFVVLCDDVDDEGYEVLVDRLQEGVAGEYWLRGGVRVTLGLSVGHVLVEKPTPAEEVLRLADRQLYREKLLHKQGSREPWWPESDDPQAAE